MKTASSLKPKQEVLWFPHIQKTGTICYSENQITTQDWFIVTLFQSGSIIHCGYGVKQMVALKIQWGNYIFIRSGGELEAYLTQLTSWHACA
jgi:hypothetical protein